MVQFILRERVVSDDVLTLSDKDCVFKGGYIAIVEYNTFQNAWQDKKHVKKFKNRQRVEAFLNKNYTEEELCDLDFSETNL
jgi:hypothetical protein